MSQYDDKQQAEATGFTGRGFGAEENAGEYGEGLGSDPLVMGDAPKKKRSAPLVLIIVVGVAIGALFSMRTLTKVTASTPHDPKVDRIIEDFVKRGPPPDATATSAEDREVIGLLKGNFTELRVGKLGRDDIFPPEAKPNTTTPVVSGRPDQVNRAADQLTVKMIIMGSQPLANINGKIVKTNGTVDIPLGVEGAVRFRVVEITADNVTVESEAKDGKEPFRKTLPLKKDR